MKRIIPVILLLLFSVAALAQTTYYVDVINGNDAWTGTLPDPNLDRTDGPWRTSLKLNRSSFQAADAIKFRRGQEFLFEGIWTIQNDGIAVTSYGDSIAKPILTGSLHLGQGLAAWQNLGDGVFRYAWTNWSGYQVWEDDVPLKKASDTTLLDGGWYFSEPCSTVTNCTPGQGLYYRPTQTGTTPQDYDIRFARNSQLFVIHDRAYLTFSDLNFEYIPGVFWGEAKSTPIHHLTIENNTFNRVATGLIIESNTTVQGVALENHDIVVSNNSFDTIRFASKIEAVSGLTKSRNLTVTGNTVRNVAPHGAYVLNDTSQDVEVFSFQNPSDVLVADNDIRDGVKRAEGKFTVDGNPIWSIGVVIWIDPSLNAERFRIERNRFDNLGHGIAFGSSTSMLFKDSLIANNIISNCEEALHLNAGADSSVTGIFFNTLYNNDISINLYSGANNYDIKNNVSILKSAVTPSIVDYHVWKSTFSENTIPSRFDYNLYIPDGAKFYNERTATLYQDLTAWRAATGKDIHSIAAPDVGLISHSPVEATQFKLTPTSPAINAAQAVSHYFQADVTMDFGQRTRLGGWAPDIGAWEQDSADLSLTMSANPNSVYVGNQLTYTLVATNFGSNEASGVVVSDSLPSEANFVSATPTQGTCTSGQTVICALGNLANGNSAAITIVVAATVLGTLVNTASISGHEPDPITPNNSAGVSMNVAALPSCQQGSYKLSGTVTRSSNNPAISGVTLTLKGTNCSDRVTTTTKGKYTFSALLNDNYTVTPSKASCTSFNPASKSLTLYNSDKNNVNFTGACP